MQKDSVKNMFLTWYNRNFRFLIIDGGERLAITKEEWKRDMEAAYRAGFRKGKKKES